MRLYWKVKIDGKWTFRKAELWRFEPTALTDYEGYLDGYMGGVFVPIEVIDEWRDLSNSQRWME